MSWRGWGPALVGLLVAGCMPQDRGDKLPPRIDPKKPSWWPDPPPRYGLAWPPPRPENWDGEWPPPRDEGEPLKPWIDLYGEAPDPAKDDRFKEPGRTGNVSFANNFGEIFEDAKKPPGCGLHSIRLFAGENVQSCDPPPEATWRKLCGQTLDETAASERCRVVCQLNPKQCQRDHLFTPPLDTGWSCVEPSATNADGAYANCATHWLCDCWEE